MISSYGSVCVIELISFIDMVVYVKYVNSMCMKL